MQKHFGIKDNRLTENARHLRQASTDVEKILWQKLRNRQLAEVKFRRQFPVYGYVWTSHAKNYGWESSWMAGSIILPRGGNAMLRVVQNL